MKTIIYNGVILTPFESLSDYCMLIEDDRILSMLPAADLGDLDVDRKIDANGGWITPGLIDIHIHGGNYADTMDANKEAFDAIAAFLPKFGVTSFLFTTGTAPDSQIDQVIDSYGNYEPPENGAVPLGIHLEGPYLSAKKKGAQPEEFIREPDPDKYRLWFETGFVKLMTVAPEVKGALALIEAGQAIGVEFAAGHTVASYEEMKTAIDHGLRQATHLFNGMESLHHRRPGVVGAALTDPRLYAQLIADGIHVHPAVVKLVFDLKKKDRTILITDAIRAAGLGDGKYDLLGQEVHVREGEARIASGSLAGSVLTMDQALRNVIAFCELPVKDAVYAATFSPAESLHLESERGQLRPGSRADLVIFDQDLMVVQTIIGGNIVYERESRS